MALGDGSSRGVGGGLWYATLLFILLLVLPSTYLGYGQWKSIQSERDEAIEDLPGEVADSADRLVLAIREHFEGLIQRERARPFWHYREDYRPISSRGSDLALIPSPLVSSPLSEGVQGHFSYTREEGREAMVHLFLGSDQDPSIRDALEEDLLRSAEELVELDWKEEMLLATAQFEDIDWTKTLDRSVENFLTTSPVRIPLPHAAVNLSKETDIDCLRENLPVLDDLQDHEVNSLVTSFRVRAIVDSSQTNRIVATRRVFIDSPEGLTGALPDCFEEISYGTTLVQGFFLDPSWLLTDIPKRMAATTIPTKIKYRLPGQAPIGADSGRVIEITRSIFDELNIETESSPLSSNEDQLLIGAKTSRIERIYKSRTKQLFGTIVILTAALGTGLLLLLRSVRSSLREAARTRNFVAAVSHELRTPVAALRLYGEMLSEGWAKDEAKRNEYHQRIVRESERLELLVDRVMQKTRLETTGVEPIPTDLKGLVEQIVESMREGRDDILIEAEADTPLSLADPEGVRSILENLIDNARKYAKSSEDDPMKVSLKAEEGVSVLEVSDRGPGVPRAERGQLFDAFYRSGDEERRSAKGIGLGLHLAALHANAMGAELDVLDRPGGGAIFSVRFKSA